MTSIQVQEIKELKEEYGIESWAAFRYLQARNHYRNIVSTVLKELQEEDSENMYRPSEREVANLCRFLWDTVSQECALNDEEWSISTRTPCPEMPCEPFYDDISSTILKHRCDLFPVDYKRAIKQYCRSHARITEEEVRSLLEIAFHDSKIEELKIALAITTIVKDCDFHWLGTSIKNSRTREETNYLLGADCGPEPDPQISLDESLDRQYILAKRDRTLHRFEIERKLATNYIIVHFERDIIMTKFNISDIINTIDNVIKAQTLDRSGDNLRELRELGEQWGLNNFPEETDDRERLQYYRLAILKNKRFLEKFFSN